MRIYRASTTRSGAYPSRTAPSVELDALQEEAVHGIDVLVGVRDVAADTGDELSDGGDEAGLVGAGQEQHGAHAAATVLPGRGQPVRGRRSASRRERVHHGVPPVAQRVGPRLRRAAETHDDQVERRPHVDRLTL